VTRGVIGAGGWLGRSKKRKTSRGRRSILGELKAPLVIQNISVSTLYLGDSRYIPTHIVQTLEGRQFGE
jgi:hypothetical protein